MSLYRAPFPSAWNPTVSMPARSLVWRPAKKNISPRMYSSARRINFLHEAMPNHYWACQRLRRLRDDNIEKNNVVVA